MKCYICGESNFLVRKGEVRDLPETKIYECPTCGLVFLDSFEHIHDAFYEDSPIVGPIHSTIDAWLRITEIDDQRRFEKFAWSLGGKKVLFVGTKNESKIATRQAADALNMPYVVERWVGGIFTNFPEIKKRIARMKDLASKKEKGELDVYTKKERLILQWEEDRLIKLFGGLADMNERPAALIVIDPKKEKNAIAEAKKVGVPVIALMNTDCDYADAQYPIPGNDTSTASIKFILDQIVAAYRNK